MFKQLRYDHYDHQGIQMTPGLTQLFVKDVHTFEKRLIGRLQPVPK